MNQELFKKVAYAYKHGEGTPVAIGNKIFVSFPDEKTGNYTKTVKDTIILLHCNEVTEKCLDKNKDGELEYWGGVDNIDYQIKLLVPSGVGFFSEYYAHEIVHIRPN